MVFYFLLKLLVLHSALQIFVSNQMYSLYKNCYLFRLKEHMYNKIHSLKRFNRVKQQWTFWL